MTFLLRNPSNFSSKFDLQCWNPR